MEYECLSRRLRAKYGITLRELSQAAGVSFQHISRIELEESYHTAGEECLLQKAFLAVATKRHEEADRLKADVAAGVGRLLSTEMEELL